MASGTLTSRILGLFRDIAMGALFERTVTDAWAAAFRIPNLFRRLLSEGSLSVSFIPVFMETHAADAEGTRARNLVNGLYTLLLIVLGGLTLLGVLFTEEIFRLLLSDAFTQLGEKWALTVRLGRIMFGFIFFVSTYAYFMGILNALGSFGLPALAPALLNVSMLCFTFLPPQWFSGYGDGLAWGVLVGGVLQAALLWGALKKRDYLPRWQGGRVWSADIRRVLKSMLPGIIGMGFLQFSTLVHLYFASSLPEGAISYIYWADRLLELPLTLISVSIGSVLLPALSALTSVKEKERFRETAQESFAMNFFLAWPAALGLYFLAEPIVENLFLRGHFSMVDVGATASILQVYAVSLLMLSCARVLMPIFFAVENMWYPAGVTIFSVVVNIGLAPRLMRDYALVGLVGAGTVAATVNVVLLMVGLQWRGLGFQSRVLLKSIGKSMLASLALVLALQAYGMIEINSSGGFKLLALLMTIGAGILFYFVFAALLRSQEFTKIRQSFRL